MPFSGSRAITKGAVIKAARECNLEIRDTSEEVAVVDPVNHKPIAIFEKSSKRLQLGFITTFRLARIVNDFLWEIIEPA